MNDQIADAKRFRPCPALQAMQACVADAIPPDGCFHSARCASGV